MSPLFHGRGYFLHHNILILLLDKAFTGLRVLQDILAEVLTLSKDDVSLMKIFSLNPDVLGVNPGVVDEIFWGKS